MIRLWRGALFMTVDECMCMMLSRVQQCVFFVARLTHMHCRECDPERVVMVDSGVIMVGAACHMVRLFWHVHIVFKWSCLDLLFMGQGCAEWFMVYPGYGIGLYGVALSPWPWVGIGHCRGFFWHDQDVNRVECPSLNKDRGAYTCVTSLFYMGSWWLQRGTARWTFIVHKIFDPVECMTLGIVHPEKRTVFSFCDAVIHWVFHERLNSMGLMGTFRLAFGYDGLAVFPINLLFMVWVWTQSIAVGMARLFWSILVMDVYRLFLGQMMDGLFIMGAGYRMFPFSNGCGIGYRVCFMAFMPCATVWCQLVYWTLYILYRCHCFRWSREGVWCSFNTHVRLCYLMSGVLLHGRYHDMFMGVDHLWFNDLFILSDNNSIGFLYWCHAVTVGIGGIFVPWAFLCHGHRAVPRAWHIRHSWKRWMSSEEDKGSFHVRVGTKDTWWRTCLVHCARI